MTLLDVSVTLQRITCCSCGIVYAIPQTFQQEVRDNHQTFYCPNGHRQWYPAESESEKLLKLLRQRENELAQKVTANIQLDNQLTKIKKDIAVGKCPCCGKTFKHLANHMARKHPKGR